MFLWKVEQNGWDFTSADKGGKKMIEFAKITKERVDLTTNFRNIKEFIR